MKTRDFRFPLHIRAQTLDWDARTVEVTMATEQPVDVWDNRHGMIQEVLRTDGAEFPDQVPLLDNHRRESVDDVLGSMRLRHEGNVVVGLVRFFDDENGIATRTLQKIRDGHLTDFSIGYRILEHEMIMPGATSEIAGRDYTAGGSALRVATRYQIKEGSACPIGADSMAKARSDREEDKEEEEDDKPAFIKKTERVVKETSSEESAGPPAEDDEEKSEVREEDEEDEEMGEKSYPKTTNSGAIELGAVRKERERAAAIYQIGGNPEILSRAVSEGWTVNKAKSHMLDYERGNRSDAIGTSTPTVHVKQGRSGSNKADTLRAIAAGMFAQTGGAPEKLTKTRNSREQDENERIAEMAYARQFDRMSFGAYVAEIYEACTGKRASRDIQQVMDQSRAAISTMDLANVFTTTFNAQLVASFEESMPDIIQIASVVDVPDFRANPRERMGQLGNLARLSVGGIAEHFTRSDISETYTARRYAGQAAFDEQDVINDRLGALKDFPRRMGLSATRVPADLVAYILLNGETAGLTAGAIFSSGNANLDTSSALASATLQAAISAMWVQQEDSVNLNIKPQFLVVPPSLVWTARELIESGTILYGADDESVRGSKNVLQNAVQIISDARLENGVTDPATDASGTGSATSWYLSAGSSHPSIELGYVRGTGRSPRVRSYALDRGQYGMGWDVSLDCGAGALDYRGLHKSNA
jgi:phage major head subunit gpT-like protein